MGFKTRPAPDRTGAGPLRDPDEQRRESLRRIRELQSRSNRGLWHLCLFLAISLGARWDFRFLPSLPPGIRSILGTPPPSSWISVALVVYSFSAIVLILSRMMGGTGSRGGLDHVGYLTGFYVFYHFSGSLRENFWAVLAAGITILGLAAYAIWTQHSELIQEEMERLARLDKQQNPSADQ
jgi:hypothetical protein